MGPALWRWRTYSAATAKLFDRRCRSSRSRRATRDGRHHGVSDGGALSNATTAVRRASPTTPVAIGTVRSARARRARNGPPNGKPHSFPCRISTSSSPCRRRPERLLSRTRPWCHPVPLRGGDAHRHRGRPQAPRRPAWVTAVLHTWGQTLQHHPHAHCVVPGGGPSPEGTRWVACRPGFFLPVRVHSRLFRACFCESCKVPSRLAS